MQLVTSCVRKCGHLRLVSDFPLGWRRVHLQHSTEGIFSALGAFVNCFAPTVGSSKCASSSASSDAKKRSRLCFSVEVKIYVR